MIGTDGGEMSPPVQSVISMATDFCYDSEC